MLRQNRERVTTWGGTSTFWINLEIWELVLQAGRCGANQPAFHLRKSLSYCGYRGRTRKFNAHLVCICGGRDYRIYGFQHFGLSPNI